MKNKLITGIGFFEGRSYIVGRSGHIRINDPFASRFHAELNVVNGRFFLRDLGSSNGTYLVSENKLERLNEGYVRLRQPILIGSLKYTVRDLLAIASPFDYSFHYI